MLNIDFVYIFRVLFRCRSIVYPAVISIALGIACITAVLNIGQAMKSNIIESLSLTNNSIEVNFRNTGESNDNYFTQTQIKKISVLVNYNEIGLSSSINLLIDEYFVNVLGINSHYYTSKFSRDIYSYLMEGEQHVAIIPKHLKSITKTNANGKPYIRINDRNFIVIKEYVGNNESSVYVPIKALRNDKVNRVERLLFINDSPEKIINLYRSIELAIKNIFGQLNGQVTIKFSREIIEEITKNITEIQKYLLAISLIIMVVATINVSNTLNRLISIRKLEFGIRLAYGEKKNNIKFSLLLETILISQIGVITGAVFYMIISLFIHYLIPSLIFTFYIEYFIYAVLIGFTSAIFSAITPSSKIMNLSVIKILKDL